MGNFDMLPCGYVSFRDDGVITGCNSTIASWLRYPREEIVGKSIEAIFTLATRIFYNTHFFPLIKLHSKASEIFLSLKTKDNRDVPVLANAERTLEQSHYVIHCVFIAVKERKKFEQELLEARRKAENALKENEELTALTKVLEENSIEIEKHHQHQIMMNEDLLQFSKIISHDLQEPIRKIQIFNDSILKDPGTILTGKSKILSSKIEHAAARLKMLTASLEEYITIDYEKVYKEVDLNKVIETAKSRAADYRQFFELSVEMKQMPKLLGHPRQLELLFFHLMDNAIQFRSPARKLEIKISHLLLQENIFRTSRERYKYTEHLRISFEDNGVGFSEEYQDYVFQLFKKLDTSTSGLGIGLPLVKRIVQHHSGDVRVISAPGKGTRFEIQLPINVTG